MYWRSAEILETLNPAMKLGRGNGGFREIRNLVLESWKPTNELQAAKEGLSGVRPRAARQGGLATTVPEESN
jgi:hypothetical protein